MPALPAQLTIENARVAAAELSAAIATDPVLLAGALTALDSAALAVLLQCRRAASAAGQRLQVQGAPPKLVELARLYGVAELLDLENGA
ncbi:MAG: lipid asymmetry maintenance protein MlaB [Aquabacterium sp.]